MSAARRVHPVLAVVVALAVLAPAVLAGRALFGPWSITVHGVLGNATFAVALALVAAAVVARAGRHAVAVAVLLAVVLTAQIGLGYASRDRAEAAAWHIPNGVLAFAPAIHQSAPRGAAAQTGVNARPPRAGAPGGPRTGRR